MSQHDDDAIAAFIHASGVTRCPTACAAPTQAIIAAADRLALRQLAERREVSWKAKQAARADRPAGNPRLRWNMRDKERREASPLRHSPHLCAEIYRPSAGFDL